VVVVVVGASVVVGAVVLVGVEDEMVESALSVESRLQAPATSTSAASAAMAGEVTMLRVDMSDNVSSRPCSRRDTERVRTVGGSESATTPLRQPWPSSASTIAPANASW
jgi:hypothetical protein